MARVPDFYLQMHELQLPTPHYHHHHPYQLSPSNAIATPAYELTEGAGGPYGEPAGGDPHQALSFHDAPKRKAMHYSGGCDTPMQTGPLIRSPIGSARSPIGSARSPIGSARSPIGSARSPIGSARSPIGSARSRKTSSYGTASAYDDDSTEDSRSTRTLPDKKQNHSEIEKRRRDKMNTYITELSAIVPMCGAMARKLDKLTVLRMAVQHLRSVRGALSACPLTARPRPACLSERDLNALIVQAAHDSFLLVVGCDRGRLLYVSASVSKMLHYDQSELLGQSLFDILHPKDVAKVKEQLSASDLSPRERLIDAKTMLPVKADLVAGASRLCLGARRSFFCRVKTRAPSGAAAPAPSSAPSHAPPSTSDQAVKEETELATKLRKKHSSEKKYCVVQCTGYLKSWAPAEMCEGGGANGAEASADDDACNLSCLVAVGRALPDLTPPPPPPVQTGQMDAPGTAPARQPPTRRLQYVSRHATDGKFLFVDQRVTLALGFLPQELLGTSVYEYVGGGQLGAVARTHKAALLRRDALLTPPYSFRRKDGTYARLQTHFKPFKNPWTKDVECMVANNTVVTEEESPKDQNEPAAYELFKHSETEMQRLIDSQVESHKIGSAIAEEAMSRSSSAFSLDLPQDLLHDTVFSHQCLPTNIMYEQVSLVDNLLDVEAAPYQVRNNVPLSAAVGAVSPPGGPGGLSAPPGPGPAPLPINATPPPVSPPLPPLAIDGNGEAAMAVIMSLLEADAGLGGPVNFSSLPWPLP